VFFFPLRGSFSVRDFDYTMCSEAMCKDIQEAL
jgi:hypothetical protein